jgi:N-methylhydantoinase A
MTLRIGIDVGGTFTDVTTFDEDRGEVAVRKYASNPADPARVIEGITQDIADEHEPDAVSLILHGSTAALNTLLEDRGARIGLLTTRGFRDVYEIGRQWRGEDVFNIFPPAPKMLLTRDRIYEIGERLDARGAIVEPLSGVDVEVAARKLVADGIEAIAICFLFSYANPAHEQEAAAIVRRIAPQIYLSLSSEVNPEWREYERTASTVANAYIGPVVSHYLHALEALAVRQFPGVRALMMKSDGGAGSAKMLARMPIQTVMSGPVAGVIGSRHLGDLKRIENLISFDAGGTSSDMAVIPGRPLYKSGLTVARHPLRCHTIDIETIGAGGGSIASVELGSVLKVGPQSAGSDPGPACYDRGGVEPTLTDALVALGHLNPDALLEGEMPIKSARSHDAIGERIAKPLGLSVVAAAWGILTVLASNIMNAMRTITIERGYDPREFTLVPFGGMGPTIAGRFAGELGIGRLLIPRDPGTFSAYGMLLTDVQQTRHLTRIMPLDQVSAEDLNAVFLELEERALADLTREGFAPERVETQRSAGMRYRGQSYEVSVPVPALGAIEAVAALARRFHDAHHRRYGHMAEREAIEIVNFEVTGVGLIPKPTLKPFSSGPGGVLPAPCAERMIHLDAVDAVSVPIYRRNELAPDTILEGPAVIEEKTSTIVLYRGQTARVDNHLNIAVEVRGTFSDLLVHED